MCSQLETKDSDKLGGYWNCYPLSSLLRLFLPKILAEKAAKSPLNFVCMGESAEEDANSLALLLCEAFDLSLDRPVRIQVLDEARRAEAENLDGFALRQASCVGTHTFATCFRYDGKDWKARMEAPIELVRRRIPLDMGWEGVAELDGVLARRFSKQGSEYCNRILQLMRNAMSPNGLLLLGAQDIPSGELKGFTRLKPHLAGAYGLNGT